MISVALKLCGEILRDISASAARRLVTYGEACARAFFRWYNEEHHHSGIGLMPPKVVHYGGGEQLRAQRSLVLEAAYAAHPERFVRGKPTAPALPEAVWINKPLETDQNDSQPHENELVIETNSPSPVCRIKQQALDEAADTMPSA